MFSLESFSDTKSPIIKPKVIGYFSIDGNKKWSQDASQLNYYYSSAKIDKNSNYDLNYGIENAIRDVTRSDKTIDETLLWIKKNYDKVQVNPNTGKWFDADFVCRRGHLTTIMKSYYDKRDSWVIRVVKFKGTIYICQYDDEESRLEKRRNQDKKCMSWGFKFEKYLSTKNPHIPPDTKSPVNEIEAFHCVFKTNLNKKILLYSAEIDSVISDEIIKEPLPLDKLEFVELKTSAVIESKRQKITLEKYKLFSWWCQNVIVGIDKIICGFRNESGIVKSIDEFQVSEISKKYGDYWGPHASVNVLDQFLQFVKDNVKDDYNETIYLFQKLKCGDIEMSIEPGNSTEYSFLPSWFTD